MQSEMELAFAGLHQLCAPMLDHLDRIPVPQRDALRTAFGVAAGSAPDRFLVGLAVLSLLSDVAGDQPLICLIDDEQWLDQASEQTLGFVARRLAADPVVLVFSARTAVGLISSILRDVTRRGEGYGITCAEWASSVLSNGLGRPHDALAAAERATAFHGDMGFSKWALVELVEAATHSGMTETAAAAYCRLTEMTGPAGTDWALGLTTRSRALLSEGEEAEACYREAIERMGRTRLRVELARAHLLYGEWLRRENRRGDARVQLRAAHEMLDAMGVAAFAERTRRELAATGETVRARTVDAVTALTAQEAYIARLARDGRTNAEIGSQLFYPYARSNGTCARSSSSSASAPAVSWPASWTISGRIARRPRSRAGYGHARIRMPPSATCTSYTLSGRAAGPWITAPVVTSNSEPWHWHVITVLVSSPPDRGHELPAQVQRSSNV